MKLPGLIDIHVHMREPGAAHKEDWDTGTAAALAGGVTTVLAMPNTQPPTTDKTTFEETLALARQKARCDFGLFVGAGRFGTDAEGGGGIHGSTYSDARRGVREQPRQLGCRLTEGG